MMWAFYPLAAYDINEILLKLMLKGGYFYNFLYHLFTKLVLLWKGI